MSHKSDALLVFAGRCVSVCKDGGVGRDNTLTLWMVVVMENVGSVPGIMILVYITQITSDTLRSR